MLIISIICVFSHPASAAECVPIQKVSLSNITNSNGQYYFKCFVEVGPGNGGSPNVSCGIRNSQKSFPENYCPSDPPYFAGWQGNIATFNCAIPANDTIIDPSLSPQLVGRDFQTDGCDVNNNGVGIPLTGFDYQGPPSNNGATQPSNSKEVQTTVKNLLNIFLSLTTGRPVVLEDNPSSDDIDVQPTVDPAQFLDYDPNSGSGSTIMNLIERIVSNPKCGKVITQYNVKSCLNSFKPPLMQAVYDRIMHSASAHEFLQCVGWVETIADLLGYPPLKKNDSAFQYANPGGYSNKYVFISKNAGIPIQPGDIVIWSGGKHGHIAFVVEVKPDNIRFRVTEANMSPGRIDWQRWTTTTQSNLKGWLRPKS